MKHEIGIEKPEYVVEDWSGKYSAFSWLEYVVTVPNAIFIVTTLKPNGNANANLHSWGLLLGHGNAQLSLLAILNHTHTYDNILRTKEWVVNYPGLDDAEQCSKTIQVNLDDNDEIEESGFTREESKFVSAPRIAESSYVLECRLLWHKPLTDNSQWHLFCGKVVHVAVDDEALPVDQSERMNNLKLMYNVRGTVNPLNDEYYGPNAIGLLKEIVEFPTAE